MKKILTIALAFLMGLSAMAQSGVNWDEFSWVVNSNDKYKVQKVENLVDIVSVQQFGDAVEQGIYVTTPSAISECSVNSFIQGAGILLYLSSFTAKETEVSITNAEGTFSFWVYYADGTGDIVPPTPVDLTGVELPATANVYIGRTTTLKPVFTPANATNKNVTWKSDNEGVATVADGVVTGVAAGTANITVTTEQGGFTATCAVTVKDSPTAEETTWDADDKNVAYGCATWFSACHSGEKRFVTDGDNGSGALQLLVNEGQPVEWLVLDLGFNYDVTKINLATTGDRKDKVYAIYVASKQEGEVAFADGNDVLADAWTLAFEAEDDYENTGVTPKTFAVDLKNVRYIKYVGVERNHNDMYGTGFCEIRVAGTTQDTEATTPHHMAITSVPNLTVGFSGNIEFTVYNSSNGALPIDASKVTASSSNTDVANVSVAEGKITATGVSEGTATITINYGELSAQTTVEIHPAVTSAPVPTVPATAVLSLYSDAYPKYDFNWFDWGGCAITRENLSEGDEVAHVKNWKYLGSQFFDGTDVSGYDYMHIDVYSPVETTIGIVPITKNDAGGNNPERGVTVNLAAYQWNSIEIPVSQFVENGVVDLNRIYQMKFIKSITKEGAELNQDGSFDIFVDNLYFAKKVTPSVKPEFTIEVAFSPASDISATMSYTINHTNAQDVDHYVISVVEEVAENGMLRAAGRTLAEVEHSDMNNLTGTVTLNDLDSSKATTVKVHGHAVLKDGTTANATNADSNLIGEYIVNTTTTVLDTIVVDNDCNAVEYYNLQGVRVANPESGLYIRRCGNTVTKVMIR